MTNLQIGRKNPLLAHEKPRSVCPFFEPSRLSEHLVLAALALAFAFAVGAGGCRGTRTTLSTPDGAIADVLAGDSQGNDIATGDAPSGDGSGSDGAETDGPNDMTTSDAPADGAVCQSIIDEYSAAVMAAKSCTVGAAHQCELRVRAGFFCNCTTVVNSGQDALAAIVARFDDNGCRNVCTGICAQQLAASCMPDPTSASGGRCMSVNLRNLANTDDGGTFSVHVGEEIDITLQSIGPGSYSISPTLSSSNLTIIEITIPAGPMNPGGPTRLYRLRAEAAGQVQIQIPFEATDGGAPHPPFAVTVTITAN
jgi:hypothetical protein